MQTFKIILLLVLMTIFTFGIISEFSLAELSDDTLKEVEKLRWKHSGLIGLSDCSNTIYYDSDIIYEWYSIYFEDGILYVKTQNGTWFIEMEKVE